MTATMLFQPDTQPSCRYGALADVEEAIKAKRQHAPEHAMLSEEVGPDDIATVVARWTGIPVSRLQQAERARLLSLKEQLHKRVVGQVSPPIAHIMICCRGSEQCHKCMPGIATHAHLTCCGLFVGCHPSASLSRSIMLLWLVRMA